jgi:hypothetical protein
MAEVEDSLKNFILSYRDILTRQTLPIFVGGLCINKTVVQGDKEEKKGTSIDSTVIGEASILKGAVRGGLEK